jgi:hypothetical protein
MSWVIVTDDGRVPEYLTSGQLAAIFGVTTSAIIKRTNAGMYEHTRTPRGHRRFPSAQFKRLRAVRPGEAT